MPRQGITIVEKKDKKTGKSLILIRRTGFVDLWWYNNHFYTENGKLVVAPVDLNKIISDYNKSQQAKKKIVIIRR